MGSIPELGRSPGEGNGNPLQCSRLENDMDRRACSPWGFKSRTTSEAIEHARIPGFAELYRSCVFHKLKVCGNPALS